MFSSASSSRNEEEKDDGDDGELCAGTDCEDEDDGGGEEAEEDLHVEFGKLSPARCRAAAWEGSFSRDNNRWLCVNRIFRNLV